MIALCRWKRLRLRPDQNLRCALRPPTHAMNVRSFNSKTANQFEIYGVAPSRKLLGACPPTLTSRPRLCISLIRSEEHTSELQSQSNLVCRLLLEKKKTDTIITTQEVRYTFRCRASPVPTSWRTPLSPSPCSSTSVWCRCPGQRFSSHWCL